MADEEEKRSLLPAEEPKINEENYGGVVAEEQDNDILTAGGQETRRHNAAVVFVLRHKEKIPGYEMSRMVRQSGVYSLYVLGALLVVYLFNQLDRYTLPIVTTSMGPDLRYGDKTCQPNPHANSSVLHDANFNTSICTSTAFQ